MIRCKVTGHSYEKQPAEAGETHLAFWCSRCLSVKTIRKDYLELKAAKKMRGKVVVLDDLTADEEEDLQQPNWLQKLYNSVRIKKDDTN